MGYKVAGRADATSYAVIRNPIVGDPVGQKPTVHVRDITNGRDLYDRDADSISEYPASCCKLMTLLLAREYHAADWTTGTVTVTTADITQPVGYTTDMAGFANGDVVTWESLAHALLLPSGADACNAIARTIGTELYVAAGSTGNTGVTRFEERMNERAAELGLTNTVFVTPFGGSKTGSTVRSKMSARDLSTLCVLAMDSVCRAIAQKPTYGIPITGGRTTTLTVTMYNRFINGPSLNQQGVSDPSCKGGKNGVWIDSGNYHNLTQIWTTPSGVELVITTMGSQSIWSQSLDQHGLIAQAYLDFAYLTDNADIGTDASIANVKWLVSGSPGTDESSVARTITKTSSGVGNPLVQGSTKCIVHNQVGDELYIADAADLTIGSGNMTAELVFAGFDWGIENLFLFRGGASKEWCFNYNSQTFNLYASSDGTNWVSGAALSVPGTDYKVFFNGAPRRLAVVKNSSTWALYIDGERMTGTITVGTAFNATTPLYAGYQMDGRLDDIRVTIGTARYTANMVPFVPRKFPRS